MSRASRNYRLGTELKEAAKRSPLESYIQLVEGDARDGRGLGAQMAGHEFVNEKKTRRQVTPVEKTVAKGRWMSMCGVG